MVRFAVVLSLILSTQLRAQDAFVVPIQASSPHVFFALTDEKDPDEGTFTSEARAPSQGNFLPFDQPSNFEVAVYDTGSPATIMGRDEYENFGIREAGVWGTEITPIGGVGDTVDAINSDPVGVFATGFDSLLTNPRTGEQVVDKSQLKGTITNSVLYASSGVDLPNLIGTSTASFYTTVLNYGDPRILDYQDQTYRSPSVTLHELGSLPEPDRRIQLIQEPGALGAPAFLINLGGIGIGGSDLRDNPSAPTVAGSFWIRADIKNNGVTRSPTAILDTGAQATIVSEQMAAELGFDVINDDPDFVVRIAGVTGESDEVPGFYADEFTMPGTDGGVQLQNVPLIVFNLTDPRDGVNTLDALIGMNVFANRDVVLNPEPGNSYLGVSDAVQIRHAWSNTAATGDWGAGQNWDEPGIPAIDWYADVQNLTGLPQTVHVREDSTISMLVTGGMSDNPDAKMTVSVDPGKTLQLFGSVIIQEGSTVHLDQGDIDPLSVELRGGSLSGHGNVGGEVLSQGQIIPGGVDSTGKVTFLGSVDQLSRGSLVIELGDNADREDLQFDQIEVGGNFGVNGKLELSILNSYQPARGDEDVFPIVVTEENALGAFDEILLEGIPLEREFLVGADRRAIRDHVGDGRFITVQYPAGGIEVVHHNAQFGDLDGSGQVNFDDFLILSLNFGLPGTWIDGDFDGDNVVAFADFLALSANFEGSTGGAASVPEPTAFALLLVSAIVGASLRRRRVV